MVLLDKVVSDTGWSKPLILGEDVTVSVNEEEEIVETPPQNSLPKGVTYRFRFQYTNEQQQPRYIYKG